MSMRDHVRKWLGIDGLPSVEMYKAMEARQQTRHSALMAEVKSLGESLRIAHTFDPPSFTAPELDWDTVQALALRDLQSNPPKES